MTNKEPKRLTSLSIHNFQRIHLAEIAPSPTGLTQVRGKNAQGKSTALDAVTALLCGGQYKGQRPINADAEEAEIVGEVGDLVISRKWTDAENPSRTTLKVARRSGGKVNKPQTALDALVAEFPDPSALANMKDAELAKQALAIIGAGDALQQVEEGISAAMDHRKEVKANHKAAAGVAAGFTQDGNAVDHGPATLEAMQRDCQRLGEAHLQHRKAGEAVQAKAERMAALKIALDKEMQELKEMAAEHNAMLPVTLEEAHAARDAYNKAREEQAAFNGMAPIREAQERAKALEGQVEEAEQGVVDARQCMKDMLAGIKWPNPAMGYDAEQGGLTLNGLPFASASTQERLMAAADLVMAGGAGVPLMLIRQGNDLDDDNLLAFGEHVAARGWQALIERVDSDPDGPGIYLENGAVLGAEAPAAPVAEQPPTTDALQWGGE